METFSVSGKIFWLTFYYRHYMEVSHTICKKIVTNYSPDIDKVASSVGQFIMSTVILTLIVIIYWFLKFWKVSIDFKKGLMIKEYLYE